MRNISRLRWIVFWVTLIVAFIALSLGTVLFAYGYRINWETKKIEQPGLVRVVTDPKEADIWIDGKMVATRTPINIPIFSGTHEIRAEKQNFHPYTKRFRLERGLTARFDDILLFLTDPEIEVDTSQTAVSEVNSAPIFGSSIEVFDNEVWYRGEFVTRFSRRPYSALALPNRAYLLIQVGNEIHALDTDGANDTILLKLESESPSRMIFKENGKVLLYLDGQVVRKARIR